MTSNVNQCELLVLVYRFQRSLRRLKHQTSTAFPLTETEQEIALGHFFFAKVNETVFQMPPETKPTSERSVQKVFVMYSLTSLMISLIHGVEA